MLWPGCGFWWQRSEGAAHSRRGLDTKFWDLHLIALQEEQRGSLQEPPLKRLLVREMEVQGCSRQGRCPPAGGSHLRPNGVEGTGSIPLEDPQVGPLGEHIPLLGDTERESRNPNADEVSLEHEGEGRWGSDREGLNAPLLALFLGATSSPWRQRKSPPEMVMD